MKNINITIIRIDGGTQSRAELNQEAVAEYADSLRDGAKLPPSVVFFDGTDYWLADGFHRYFAFKAAGLVSVPVEVVNGTQRDAVLWSVGANREHGLRRSNADKRKAVTTLLADDEWKAWSDRKIAEACGVNDKTVAACRASIFGNSEDTPATRTVERAGKTYQQDTSRIGKAPPSAPPAESPRKSGLIVIAPMAGAAAAPADAPRPLTDEERDDALSDFDISEELTKAMSRIEELNVEVAELKAIVEADDQRAGTQQWRARWQAAQGRMQELMGEVAAKEGRIKFLQGELVRCGKAVGVNDLDHIAAAVKKAVKAAKEEA